MPFEMDNNYESGVNIKVVGVGGGGNNAVNHMIETNIKGVEFISINTDKQALMQAKSTVKISIGDKITKGHGAGSNPEVGMKAAEESIEEIASALKGADMVFITTGMGGGTGTGAAPIVAKLARELDILTIGIVTKPFAFEGKRRMEAAESGIMRLSEMVDSLIIIPNERLKMISETKITLLNAFAEADNVLKRGVQSISDLINMPGIVNLDFADVTAIMKDAGYAHMGVGSAEGKDKAEEAAKLAVSSPLLETSIEGARGILVNITASADIGLDEIDMASTMIHDQAHPDATIIWGAVIDPSLEDRMNVTVIATGFDTDDKYEKEKRSIKRDQKDRRTAASDMRDSAEGGASFSREAPKYAHTRKDEYEDDERKKAKDLDDDNDLNEDESHDLDSDEAGLSDDDFADIMNMLKSSKKKKDNNY